MQIQDFIKPRMSVLKMDADIICSSVIAPDTPNKPAGAPGNRSIWN